MLLNTKNHLVLFLINYHISLEPTKIIFENLVFLLSQTGTIKNLDPIIEIGHKL